MRSLPFAISAALALVAAASCKSGDKGGTDKSDEQARAEAAIPALTIDEVDAQLAAGKLKPVDCNGAATRKKMGFVPGAVLTSDDDYAASELPADKTTKLVFYCMNPG